MSLAFDDNTRIVAPIDPRDANTNPKTIRVVVATEFFPVSRDLFAHMETVADAARANNDGISAKLAKLKEAKDDTVAQRQMTIAAFRGSAVPAETLAAFDAEIKIIKREQTQVEAQPRIRGVNYGEIVAYALNRKSFANPDDLPSIDEFEADEGMLAECTETKTRLRKELGRAENARRDKAKILEVVLAELDTLEKLGAPDLTDIARPNDLNDRTGFFEISRSVGFIGWPMNFARQGEDALVFNSLAFNVWLGRPEIEKRLRAAIETMPEGITAAEKTARVADLHEKIAATLRREHGILVAMEKRGNLYLRKETYHPAIQLALTAPAHLIAQYGA